MIIVYVTSIIYNAYYYQPVNAQPQTPGKVLNTYAVRVVIDKQFIKRGQTQTIDAQVSSQSGVPLPSGTRVTFSVDYADSKTTRQATVPVDASGHASYSWQIGHHVKAGEFDLRTVVDGPGFESQSIDAGQSFIVQKGH